MLRIAWFGEKIDQNIFLFLFQRKVLKILWFGKKVDQNVLTIFSPPPDTSTETFPLISIGGRADRQACADGEQGPPSARVEIMDFSETEFGSYFI